MVEGWLWCRLLLELDLMACKMKLIGLGFGLEFGGWQFERLGFWKGVADLGTHIHGT